MLKLRERIIIGKISETDIRLKKMLTESPPARSMLIMNILGWYTLVISILWIFVTDIMFVSDFAAYTGQTYSDYLTTNPNFAEIYIITKKLIGIILTDSPFKMLPVIYKTLQFNKYPLFYKSCSNRQHFIIFYILQLLL